MKRIKLKKGVYMIQFKGAKEMRSTLGRLDILIEGKELTRKSLKKNRNLKMWKSYGLQIQVEELRQKLLGRRMPNRKVKRKGKIVKIKAFKKSEKALLNRVSNLKNKDFLIMNRKDDKKTATHELAHVMYCEERLSKQCRRLLHKFSKKTRKKLTKLIRKGFGYNKLQVPTEMHAYLTELDKDALKCVRNKDMPIVLNLCQIFKDWMDRVQINKKVTIHG